MSIVTDGKHTERVTMWLTPREYMELACMADATDRKLSDMARFAVRVYMHGNLHPEACDFNVANSTHPGDEAH